MPMSGLHVAATYILHFIFNLECRPPVLVRNTHCCASSIDMGSAYRAVFPYVYLGSVREHVSPDSVSNFLEAFILEDDSK